MFMNFYLHVLKLFVQQGSSIDNEYTGVYKSVYRSGMIIIGYVTV